ncbi:MAG: AmmeMemoRadiSam system protein B [Synergistaceae bacterium]|nr:AmmeMemoRadiSam system protein B [Synergistaceae bacterium]
MTRKTAEQTTFRRLIFLGVLLSLLRALAVSASGAPNLLVSPFERHVESAIESYGTSGGTGAENTDGARCLGGITPHHDAALAMIVRFYEKLSSRRIKRVWLFSPDHFRQSRNLVALCGADWRASGRVLEADRGVCEFLDELGIVETNDLMFKREHGITLHIPLVARYFPSAKIIPIVLDPNIPDIALIMLRKRIMDLIALDDIIILSMDLSHYKTPEGMAAEDVKTLDVLRGLKFGATRGIDVDAGRAASLVLRLFKAMGAKRGVVMEHSDTSEMVGRRIEFGTSYATVLYKTSSSPHP